MYGADVRLALREGWRVVIGSGPQGGVSLSTGVLCCVCALSRRKPVLCFRLVGHFRLFLPNASVQLTSSSVRDCQPVVISRAVGWQPLLMK